MIKDRLKQARIASGMTQDEVVGALAAKGVSLTKGGLSKYERGGSIPKPSVLRALGRILGVDPSYFLEEPSIKVRWLAFRKASRMGKARQERVKSQAESEVESLLTLRRSLDPAATPEDLPPRTRVRKPEDADLAADGLRGHWRLGDQPIESVTAAIEDGGGVVVESGGGEDLFDGLSGWANGTVPVVVVSPAVSDDRRRFNLAHELGHLFMDTGKVDKRAEEKLAHRFGAAFLVPAACARRELGTKRRRLEFRELAILKQKYGLSMQGWILRAADLGIIDPSHVRTLFADMSSRGWRREEPIGFEGKERPQKLRQLTVRALAEGLLTRQQAERILPGVTREMEEVQVAGALSARSLLQMPKGERDRLMKQASALVAQDYQDGGALCGLELLSEEDHLDRSVDD
jgi:Zn-dependent peptidase ImmA (M78 family)/transcriptional regulator with XRE-family HTH domain